MYINLLVTRNYESADQSDGWCECALQEIEKLARKLLLQHDQIIKARTGVAARNF